MAWRVSISVLITLAACSCAAQLGIAKRSHASDDFQPAFIAGARLVPAPRNGTYAGADLEVMFRRRPQVALVASSFGYRVLCPPFSLEIGGNLGLGEPYRAPWEGTGFYVGAQGAALYRLFGRQDSEMGYAPGGVLVDLVLQPRVGLWAPSFRDDSDPWIDASLVVALRAALMSDIADTSNREWEQP